MKFHGNLDLKKFYLDWFGPLDRVIGTKGGKTVPSKIPTRRWTDNPNDLIKHIKMCAEEHEPNEFCRACFISSQPMRNTGRQRKDGTIAGEACAIEKLFFDFDDDTRYCPNCDIYIKKDPKLEKEKKRKKMEEFLVISDENGIKTKIYIKKLNFWGKKGNICPKCGTNCSEKPRLDVVKKEVKDFVRDIKQEVFIVETRKGYHVYIFLRQIWNFDAKNFDVAKEIYRELQEMYINKDYEFMDERILGDLMRFARVPLTIHEKTGKICQIVDRNLKPTKVRNLEYFRTYGITSETIRNIIEIIMQRRYKAFEKEKETIEKMKEPTNENGKFQGQIRPCFKKRMEQGEMNHAQRLAWLSEIYHSGYNTKEKILALCKCFNDFNKKKSMQQINDYFNHERWTWKPYKCSTIISKGWCLESDCPIWRTRHK